MIISYFNELTKKETTVFQGSYEQCVQYILKNYRKVSRKEINKELIQLEKRYEKEKNS